MQVLLFCGIQATGKSTFYKNNFFNTHIRISMDLLHTRSKEDRFLQTCFEVQQQIVVDNTNPTRAERAKYIALAQANKYKVIGYFFESRIKDCLVRNEQRTGKDKINERGIIAASNKLEIPAFSEGFDELYFVRIAADGQFEVQAWQVI
jgi:predicted kinase